MELSTIKCSYCPHKVQWITDKMPEKDGHYLVTLKSGIVTEMKFEKVTPFWTDKVIAWAVMPAPYVAD